MPIAFLAIFLSCAFANQIIDEVYASGAHWEAGENPVFDHMTIDEVKSMMGWKPASNPNVPQYRRVGASLPSSFDGREQWPACKGLFTPLNQGQCGSCWAFGATKSFGDRLCIATNATTNVLLSEQELVSCNLDGLEGCSGGDPVTAMRYIAEYGLPTSQCVPYTSGKDGNVPSCASKCVDGSAMKLYYASFLSLRWHPTVEGIMESIYTQGPVEACFTVYNDFMYYKSGVYSHVSGSELGGHCIVLLGWGKTSDGIDYWIAQNSWGNDWGLKGYFWIKKGDDECGIERQVFSIMPSL